MAERNGAIRLKQDGSLQELTISVRQAACKRLIRRIGYFDTAGCSSPPLSVVKAIFVEEGADVYSNRYWVDAAGSVAFNSVSYISPRTEGEIGQDYRHIGIGYLASPFVYKILEGRVIETLDCRGAY